MTNKKKVKRKPILGEVKIKMFVRPTFGSHGLGRKVKPKWVTVPRIGTNEELHKCMTNDAGTYQPEGNPNVALIKLYYRKLAQVRPIKLAFINFMQKCVALSHYGKVPTWFSKKMMSGVSDKVLDDYYNKAQTLLSLHLKYNDGSAGHLMTDNSLNKSFNLSLTGLSEDQLQRRVISGIRFKRYSDVKHLCRYYGDQLDNIYDIVKALSSGAITLKNANDNSLCEDYKQEFLKQVDFILNQPFGWINFLLHGGYLTKDVAEKLAKLHAKETVAATHTPAASKPDASDDSSPIGDVVAKAEQNLARAHARQRSREGRASPYGKLFTTGTGLSQKKPAWMTKLQSVKRRPSGSSVQPSGSSSVQASGAGGSSGAGGNLTREQRIAAAKAAGKKSFAAKLNALKFGRSPNLARMAGYVRPYRTSAMEDYTGMTPAMYRRHINARTGNPMGGPSPRLSRANSYYGSYALGEKLNPSFGEKKRRKPAKRKPAKRKPAKKRTRKRSKTRRRRRRKSSFGNFFLTK